MRWQPSAWETNVARIGPQPARRYPGRLRTTPGANQILLAAVPEPSTWAMMLVGFAGLGYADYRKTREPRAAV
jgi:hypothetical protein